ncbi:MAG: tetratricopeptide repeat protein [Actinomycetota bacterium]
MYTYKRRNKPGPGSIIFIVLFILTIIGLAYLLYTDRGIFWDYLPLVSIIAVVLSLIFAVFNFVRRSGIGFAFIFFFIVFLAGIIVSSIFGPFALNLRAQSHFEENQFSEAIDEYLKIVENYPSSRYYENALKNLPFAYYEDGNCIQALNYLQEATEKELIAPSLEVKSIYVDCYLEVADSYMENYEYRLAAGNYQQALNIYSNIQNEYPGSDPAFIAEHKIPELAFRAAAAYRKALDWDKSIELFNKVIEEYPSSDYAQKSSELLFVSHINRAIELKNNSEYGEAVEEFLKVIEIFRAPEDSFRVSHYRNVILSDIPPFYLENIAYNYFTEQDYKKAAYLYQVILEYNPEVSADYISYLSRSKVNYIKATSYRNLATEEDPVRINMPEKSMLQVANTSIYSTTLYLVGPQESMISILPDSLADVELSPGTYQAVLEFEQEESMPFFGNLTLEESYRYIILVE